MANGIRISIGMAAMILILITALLAAVPAVSALIIDEILMVL